MELVKILFDRISQYGFFTNILPGTVLCLVLQYFVGINLIVVDNWYLMGVIFYFVGMINNRIGSLIVGPALKLTRFIRFAPYTDFIIAEGKDEKIITLSMENNIFRSYVSVFLIATISYICKYWFDETVQKFDIKGLIILIILLVLFAFSYRKQTKLIKERIEADLKILEKL